MFSNKYLIKCLVLVVCLYSCNNSGINVAPPTLNILDDKIEISSNNVIDYSVTIQGEIVASGQKNGTVSLSLLSLCKSCRNKNEVAFIALNNNNTIPINLKVGNIIDTVISYSIEPYFDEVPQFSISGRCASLITKFSNPTQSVDLKKWLFRKKVHLDDEHIRLLGGLINQLNHTKDIEYITDARIPVIHNFGDVRYSVKSNIKADHYILYACSTSNQIEDFVEEIVSNDFELCSNSLSNNMSCYRQKNENGYLCICLIAINNDWSYKIQPLGLVAIDNMVVSNKDEAVHKDSITFPGNVIVRFPEEKPQIFGSCSVSLANWDGNGLECNCTFRVLFAGDIKSVTIKRNKSLCYPYEHRIENKKIELADKISPYTFTYTLHFEDGDNIIPIVIEDNNGNKFETEIIERAKFTYRNTNDINIDNNINIWE